MAWLWVFQSYDYVTVDSSGEAPANYIGNDGDIYNGTSETDTPMPKGMGFLIT